ncbi:hypothetical protein POM88_021951 [Heracleum sosnowskyi]|uniref:Aminotransferase-like plant mobile domain-containing protein n=1 Tax=Heracleum sosnowskyi TaxID=360622 RepID=A0AAD8IEW2_9APIA|nr:hypothetical protein POM88_021951 [Heracleum sosnowskyi]
MRRRVNPHHHTGGYRGDFDSFQPYWVTWQPYARFYEMMDANEDADMYMARHMALGRIPMVSFEFIEYQMPDRVLRQFDRPSSFGDEDIEVPVVEAHAREIDIDPSAPIVTQKSPLEVDTSAPDAPHDTPLHISPTHPLEVDPSAPDAPQDTPLHISPTHPLEVDPSAPDAPQDTPLHISPTHPLEVETSAPDPLQDTPLHVSHKRPHESFAFSHSFAFTPILLKTSTYEETPSTERVRPFVSFGFDSPSLPTVLKDKFDIDTNVDKMKDERDRGGPSRKGDLTRPLKNRKIRWLFRHWWTNDGEFLTKEKLLTLKPRKSLEDSIVNAYVELLKIRENNLWHLYPSHAVLKPTAERFFFAFSWWMAIATRFCYDLKIPPSELTGAAKDDRDNFI